MYSPKSLNLKSLNAKISISVNIYIHELQVQSFCLKQYLPLRAVSSSLKMHASVEKETPTKNYHPVCADETGLNLPTKQTDLY